jgi:hypothetical protein
VALRRRLQKDDQGNVRASYFSLFFLFYAVICGKHICSEIRNEELVLLFQIEIPSSFKGNKAWEKKVI